MADATNATEGTTACRPLRLKWVWKTVPRATTAAITWTINVCQNSVVVHPGFTAPGGNCLFMSLTPLLPGTLASSAAGDCIAAAAVTITFWRIPYNSNTHAY